MPKLQLIVEGHGEVSAGRPLLDRLRTESQNWTFQISHPIRRTINQLTNADELTKIINLARYDDDLAAILILLDGDWSRTDGVGGIQECCPRIDGPRLNEIAKTAAANVPCEVVIASMEFETWFLASLDALAGNLGIPPGTQPPDNFETKRGAKEILRRILAHDGGYAPNRDQARFTLAFDLHRAYYRTRSFKKLVKAFGNLHADAGCPLQDWPPARWANQV